MYWILGGIALLVIFILIVLGIKLWYDSTKDSGNDDKKWENSLTMYKVLRVTWKNSYFIESFLQSILCYHSFPFIIKSSYYNWY